MGCRPCAERRRKLKEKMAQKKAERKRVQAAAIGAVLSVTEAAGKVLGIGEDTEDGNDVHKDSSVSDGVNGAKPDA